MPSTIVPRVLGRTPARSSRPGPFTCGLFREVAGRLSFGNRDDLSEIVMTMRGCCGRTASTLATASSPDPSAWSPAFDRMRPWSVGPTLPSVPSGSISGGEFGPPCPAVASSSLPAFFACVAVTLSELSICSAGAHTARCSAFPALGFMSVRSNSRARSEGGTHGLARGPGETSRRLPGAVAARSLSVARFRGGLFE